MLLIINAIPEKQFHVFCFSLTFACVSELIGLACRSEYRTYKAGIGAERMLRFDRKTVLLESGRILGAWYFLRYLFPRCIDQAPQKFGADPAEGSARSVSQLSCCICHYYLIAKFCTPKRYGCRAFLCRRLEHKLQPRRLFHILFATFSYSVSGIRVRTFGCTNVELCVAATIFW